MYYDLKRIISYNNLEKEEFLLKEEKIMKKNLGFILAAVLVLNTVSSAALGFTNPLKNYNLYEDTHPTAKSSSSERETVVNDILPSANYSSSNIGVPSSPPSYQEDSYKSGVMDEVKSRNQTLRESSERHYADKESVPAWIEGPSYYPNPSFDSIVEKYRKSDFAGCMQECVSYVRQNPNDTLGFYYLAMCYTKVNDKDNAVRAYERVIELNANPMIVKYATNGRNCVMGNDNEKCYPNVNEPELVYPYADYVNANAAELTPVDPQTLINRNLNALRTKLNPPPENDEKDGNNNKEDNDKKEISLPFGTQDKELDDFINAPYGNGLSPELNNQYKQIQLKKIQSTINNGKDNEEKEINNLKNIKEFDNQKSDSETIKLAYEQPSVASEWEQLQKDPEFIKNQQELEQLSQMFGTSDKKKDNISDIIPYMTEDGAKKMSPEALQMMMMQSLMGDLTL